MEVCKVYWWKHNCKTGQYSSAKVHHSLKITTECDIPRSIDDYKIALENMEGLEPETLNGI